LKKDTHNSGTAQWRVGIAGTGFIAAGLYRCVLRSSEFKAAGVLTRRPAAEVKNFPAEILVSDIATLVESCDVVVECTGDVVWATEVVAQALAAGRAVVTMNSEFHVTTGSWFVGKGLLSEAEGDQSGSLAALHEEALALGFKPIVYGNVKGFLNHNPTLEEMEHWARVQGISVPQVTAFTDGTKIQIEQALVANGLGADIACAGLLGPAKATLADGAGVLAAAAYKRHAPIADYVLTREFPGSVFIIADHDDAEADALRYFKLGSGPHYTLKRPYHLCFFEIIKTIRRLRDGGGVLLDNSATPRISVASVAKRDLGPGTKINRGLGGFDARGEAVEITSAKGHLPIGLLMNAVIKRQVKAGEIISMDDVDIPDSLALRAWFEIEEQALKKTPKSK